MNNNYKLLVGALIVLLIVGVWGYKNFGLVNILDNKEEILSHKTATYFIQGNKVSLVNGIAFEPVLPESSFAVETKYFGNEVKYDFDSDGREDTAFILTQNTGGSGLFYYLVVGLNKEKGFVGSEGLFIGDRISPQTTNMSDDGLIVVNYADRNPGEPFSTAPSLGKSLYVKFNPNDLTLGEVVKDFEGEADPKKMSLTMKTWKWIRTELNDGTTVTPRNSDKFNLTLKADKTFSASTDCNGVGGEYRLLGDNRIIFDKMMSTLMYCEDSQEAVFSDFIQNTSSYLFTSKGELVLQLKFDSGVVIFK
jgi:heat shock protein HslJ